MWAGVEELGIGTALCGLHHGVLAADPAYAAILGLHPDAVSGVTMSEVTHPDDRGCNDRMLRMLHDTRAPFRITKRYLVGETPVWVENRVSWLGGEGDDARLLLLSRRLQPAEIARAPLTPQQLGAARSTAGYIRDIAGQLARMAQDARLPASAVALNLALTLMREEHEDVAGVEA